MESCIRWHRRPLVSPSAAVVCVWVWVWVVGHFPQPSKFATLGALKVKVPEGFARIVYRRTWSNALLWTALTFSVFAGAFLPGSETFPLPLGFMPTGHRIIWGKFHDLVFAALQSAWVAFACLVCPRVRGEVTARAVAGSDTRLLRRFGNQF